MLTTEIWADPLSAASDRDFRNLVPAGNLRAMPKLIIESIGEYDIPQGKRLINAIIDDAKADQHHSCGGNAKCTTCRVQFVAGEPQKITQAEKDLLEGSGLNKEPGVRLSCQIACEEDMSIKLIFPKPPLKNPPHPADDIQPTPVWITK